MRDKRASGNLGENLATVFLKKLGYKILGRNIVSKIGEIDILAKDREAIVLVEVKTKSTENFGEGFEMVNYFKKRKLIQLAKQLSIAYPQTVIRIDIVSVNTRENPPEIKHFISAVEDD